MTRLSFFIAALTGLSVFVVTTNALAQKRPPTVTNMHPSKLRLPTDDERGLWQLLSHQNNPYAICGRGKVLAVVQRTRQVVCAVPMSNQCQKATTVVRNGVKEAEARAAQMQAEVNGLIYDHRDSIEKLNAANIEDLRLGRRAERETDPQKKLELYKQQLTHKQRKIMPLIRQRDWADKRLDELESGHRQAKLDAARARNNLAKAKTFDSSCAQARGKGWLQQRHDKGWEYAMSNKEVQKQLTDLGIAATGKVLRIEEITDIGLAMKAQFERMGHANGKGLDLVFWSGAGAELAELAIKSKFPAAGVPLGGAKLATAFGTAYIYGFAVGQ